MKRVWIWSASTISFLRANRPERDGPDELNIPKSPWAMKDNFLETPEQWRDEGNDSSLGQKKVYPVLEYFLKSIILQGRKSMMSPNRNSQLVPVSS
jgi:hypothetical protein